MFFAGDPDTYEAEELVKNLPEFTLAIVGSEEWKKRTKEVHKDSFEKVHIHNTEKRV
ncbi:hypothetical protein KP78_37870 [Jeotgalibacillus soli]|uniref:Uncharacterized protein n=1 Tax=Jeotgalibacillus soli TaxID=889306 RepID=A0A0C2VIZ7_9BACL|nr:hypothetical protein KP78_37870 [Jeotgalibacillus soli]